MDAWKPFQFLKAWIDGFAKNSSKHPPVVDYFVDFFEKDDLSEIHILMHNMFYVVKSEVLCTSSNDGDALPGTSPVSDHCPNRYSIRGFSDNATAPLVTDSTSGDMDSPLSGIFPLGISVHVLQYLDTDSDDGGLLQETQGPLSLAGLLGSSEDEALSIAPGQPSPSLSSAAGSLKPESDLSPS